MGDQFQLNEGERKRTEDNQSLESPDEETRQISKIKRGMFEEKKTDQANFEKVRKELKKQSFLREVGRKREE